MQPLYIVSLLVLAVLSLTAVYSHSFDDNLIQRFGLTFVCFGAVFRLWEMIGGLDLTGPRYLMTYGCALFATGTALRFWRDRRRNGKRDRRSKT